MDSSKLIYSIISFIALVGLVSAQSCLQADVDRCLKNFDGAERGLDEAVVPTLSEQQMREHCRLYQLFEDCMDNVKPYCGVADRLMFDGIEDAYQWLCVDAFDEYLKYRVCFSDSNLHYEGEKCNKTLSVNLAELRISNYTTSYYRDRLCQYVEQYLDCVESVVQSFCGKDAGTWQRTLDEKSLEPLVGSVGCEIGDAAKPDKSQGTYARQHWLGITLGVLISVLTIIVIMSVAMIVMRKNKRRQAAAARTTTSRTNVVGAPPPYEGPYILYNQNTQQVGMAAGGDLAGPLPDKTNPNLDMTPPAYSAADLSVPEYSASQYEEAGYFGAESSPNVAVPLDEKDGFTNPSYVP